MVTHKVLYDLSLITSLFSSLLKDTFSVRTSLPILSKIAFANSVISYSSAWLNFTFLFNIHHCLTYNTFSCFSCVCLLPPLKRKLCEVGDFFCVHCSVTAPRRVCDTGEYMAALFYVTISDSCHTIGVFFFFNKWAETSEACIVSSHWKPII